MKLGLGGLRNLRSCWLSSEHATPVAVTRGWGCRCKPHPPKWLLEALRLHPNKTGHRRPPPVCSAAASSFSRSRLFRVACRGARSALACGCCWRVSVSDVVFMFSVESNFRRWEFSYAVGSPRILRPTGLRGRVLLFPQLKFVLPKCRRTSRCLGATWHSH